MKSPTRRRFLRNLLAFGASCVALARLPWGAGFGKERSFDAARLWAGSRDRESARVVGRLYLDAYPGEVPVLSRAKWEAVIPSPAAGFRDEAALRGALSRRVRVDFERGEVVRLEGWILSRTEARLAALAVLA